MQSEESPFDDSHSQDLFQPNPMRGLQVPTPVIRSLSASGNRRLSLSTEQRIAHKYLPLRSRQDFHHDVPPTSKRRRPVHEDFGEHLASMHIASPDEDEIDNAIIVLHDCGGKETDLMALHKKHLRQPKTVYLYPRGPYQALSGNFSWAEQDPNDNFDFATSSSILLEDIIKDVLIKKCFFPPSNIVILGQNQGAMLALASVAAWDLISFGGVVSIGAFLPSFLVVLRRKRVNTPAMVIAKETQFSIEPAQWQETKALFHHVDKELVGVHPDFEGSCEQLQKKWQPFLDFCAHRLRREEWTKQSIITFDGGGIRGYGSLLILRQLMMEIGDEEARLGAEDGLGVSSFAPCEYKPRKRGDVHDGDYSNDYEPTPTTRNVEQDGFSGTVRLPNSSLFLPCHYFNYAGGTSTGGLIAIMLSRFRMTVDDCIKEYETLGEEVFGNPRPPSMKGLLWHKFDSKVLRRVIEEVTNRRAEINFNGQVTYPCPKNRCQTVVLAYSDLGNSEIPYLFRTYDNPLENRTSKTTGLKLRNGGDAQNISIPDVGSATAAAPNYFKPSEIKIGNRLQRFKDGGFGANNPSFLTYADVILKHGNVRTCVGPFVSIGTGDHEVSLFTEKRGGWLRNGHVRNWLANLDAVIHKPSLTQDAHETMERESATDSGHGFEYLRLDGGKLLGSISLDEWRSNRMSFLTGKDKTPGAKTLEKIRTAVGRYIIRDDVRQGLKEMARVLVARRRLRTRDASAWDQYACASWYECSFKGCVRERIETLNEYLDHMRASHRDEWDEEGGVAEAKRDRRCWVYRD